MSLLSKGIGAKGRWAYVGLSPAIAFFVTLSGSWSLFYPYLQQQFGMAEVAPLALGASLIGAGDFLIGPVLCAILLDRFGPKFTYGLSAVFFVIAVFFMLALGAATEWASGAFFYYAGSLTAGIAIGLKTGTGANITAKWMPDRLGLSIGLAAMGQSLAPLWLAPVATMLIPSIGIGNAFMVFLVGAAIITIVLGVVPQRLPDKEWKPEGYVPPVKNEEGSLSLPQAMKTSRFYVLWVCTFLSCLAVFGFAMNMATIILEGLGKGGIEDVGAGMAVVATVLAVTSIINACARPVWGFIADKLGSTWRALQLLYILLAVVMIAYLWLYTSPITSAIGIALFFVCMGGTSPVHMSAVPKLFGTQFVGRIGSINMLATGFAWVIGAYVGALIKDITGSYAGALIGFAALALVSLVLVTVLSQMEKKRTLETEAS